MKNDIFSFSRFGRYLASEITTIYSTKGISILVFALVPVIVFIFDRLFSIGSEYQYISAINRTVWFVFTGYIFAVWLPSACYGHVTDRRSGSLYTMVPASGLEKTLSMILNTVIIVPMSFIAVYLLFDFIITLLAGASADSTIPVYISENIRVLSENLSLGGTGITDAVINIMSIFLLFLLGAVFFRRHKIAKTILVWIALGIVVSSVAISIIDNIADMEDVTKAIIAMDTQEIFSWNMALSVVMLIALCTGIFFRVKKIQY